MTVILTGIEKCECGHSIVLHYLEEDSDEHAGCVFTLCNCKKYVKGESKERSE